MKNITTIFLSLFFISLLHADQEPEGVQVVFRQGVAHLLERTPLKHQNEHRLLESLAMALHMSQQESISQEERDIAFGGAQEILSLLAKTGTTEARERAFGLAKDYKFQEQWSNQRKLLNVCSNNIKMLAMATPSLLNVAESTGIAYRSYQQNKETYRKVHVPASTLELDWRPQGRKIGTIVCLGVGSAYSPKALAQEDYLQLIPLAAQLTAKLFGWEDKTFMTPNQRIGYHGTKAGINLLALAPVIYHIYSEMYEPCPLSNWECDLEKDKKRESNPQQAFPDFFQPTSGLNTEQPENPQ